MKTKYFVRNCWGGKVWRVLLGKSPSKTTAQIWFDKSLNRRSVIVDMGQSELSEETAIAAVKKALNYKDDASIYLEAYEAWF